LWQAAAMPPSNILKLTKTSDAPRVGINLLTGEKIYFKRK